jgi:capsular exopolysaccharide synthesis family protein
MQDNFETAFETGQPSREFNLKEFIFKYLRYWSLLTAFVLIALTIAFIRVRYTTPIYRVNGSLFINKEGENRSVGESLENMFLFSNNLNLQNELEILKSKPLVSRVVKALGLQVSYFNKGNVRSSNIYGASPVQLEIFSLKDSSSTFTIEIEASEKGFHFPNTNANIEYGKLFETRAGVFRINKTSEMSFAHYSSDNFLITYQPLPRAAASLASAITTAQTIDQATILDISMETDNITLGKDVINALMAEYGEMNIENKRRISQATMQFIDERLDTIKNELGDVESGILKFREKNEVVDLSQQSAQQFGALAESNKQLADQQVQAGILDYLLQYMQNPANRHSLVPASLGIQEPVLGPMFSQYNTLQLQRNNLLQTTGTANPAIATLDRSVEKLREQILEALRNVQQSYRIASNTLKEEISRSRSAIRKVPSKAMGLLDIERQQKIKQDLYLFLLQKREESAISAAATVASSSPLEEATSSGYPVKPNKRNIYLLALFAGILIPIAIIAVIEMLNDKIREREEITRQCQAPIIGEIGHAGQKTLVVQAGSRTVVAEQFRIMRTNIKYMVNKVNKPVMLVTSSVSGEGKSFVATNFGAALALTGKKTVILEFDIRKPRLLKGLDMQSAKGLSNFIIGNATLDEIICPVPGFDNLYVIGCGPVPPNPSELLLDQQVSRLFEELKTRFEYIIIDSAPVGLVSDAFTLSTFADAALYIVRHGYTLKRQLSMVNDLYVQKRLPNMGLVINDIKTQGRYKGYYGYGGGSYYGYGYGYRYGYGGDYFQEEKKKSKKKRFFLFKV